MRLAPLVAAVVFPVIVTSAAGVGGRVVLPIEVVGEHGTTSAVTVDVPSGRAHDVRSLWMQIHGLRFADMASVQVNDAAWVSLTNDTVAIAEPGRSYGGIGGGVATLKMTLALPSNVVVDGPNTIRFRFNKSDGVVSGFRVVAFDLLDSHSGTVLEPGVFTQEDPESWTMPLAGGDAVRAGHELWSQAELKANSLPNAPKIRARCSDCHAHDGRDLKYFGFSNLSIVARSRFHGLSELQGQQIASYIRSLPVRTVGRPWNPPYQPGPGLDAQPVETWAAGAGLSWALDADVATLPWMFATSEHADPLSRANGGDRLPDWRAIVPLITPMAFRPDGNLNAREIPIALQLPDWNHWLPVVHPVDAWGPDFLTSEFFEWYASQKPRQSLRTMLSSPDLATLISSGRIVAVFDEWTNARRTFLKSYVRRKDAWSPELSLKSYSTQLWQLTKTWELSQEFGLEARGPELFGTLGEARTWFNTIPAATAPAAVGIPSGPSGMGGSALTNEYFNAAWYELQVLLNSGHHRHRDRAPVDWLYLIGGFRDLFEESRRPEPARLLVAVIKALQSTDPRVGPEDIAQGWRPFQNVDPTIMVDAAWTPIFEPLPAEARRAVIESLLRAWLEKNMQYPVGQYFRVGLTQQNYAPPAKYGHISGSRVWDAAPLFAAAGVDPEIIRQLQKWGASYANTAARFQYSPGTDRTRGSSSRKSGT